MGREEYPLTKDIIILIKEVIYLLKTEIGHPYLVGIRIAQGNGNLSSKCLFDGAIFL